MLQTIIENFYGKTVNNFIQYLRNFIENIWENCELRKFEAD